MKPIIEEHIIAQQKVNAARNDSATNAKRGKCPYGQDLPCIEVVYTPDVRKVYLFRMASENIYSPLKVSRGGGRKRVLNE